MDPHSNNDNNNSDSNNHYSNNDFETVDHTLLESLFYNEMMMMEESPSLLLSVLAADGTPTVDANTMAEAALLGEFGVIGGSQHTRLHHTLPPQQQQQQEGLPPTTLSQQPSHQQQPSQQQPSLQQQQQQQQQQPSLQQHQQQQPPGQPVPVAQPAAQPVPVPSSAPNVSIAAPAPNVPTAASLPYAAPNPMDDAEKRKKLVSQFATLASRLGITLPEPFAQNFTPPSAPPTAPSSPEEPPRQVQEMQSTADAAIAVVSLKRDASNLASNHAANANKRRKKPRLSDCERKLNDLKAENALLKRHLHNISNQSHKLAEEQRAAELQIRTLWSSDKTTEDELDAAVKNFTELYSDYGKRRHDELTFHLEQLGRLANPSNVTKMGLWTLGQESSQRQKNPIAGLLQKELGITPQQGKKILEQRQKIRAVSSNLKEVRIYYL
jgi:hypothetical protein